MRKAGAAIPTELTRVADKLDGLLAGKAPSAEELAPFKLNAQAKLTEQIRLANQTRVSKPGVVGAKGGVGRIDPPVPKVDVTNDFTISVSSNGGTTLRYGNPDGIAGLVVNVDKTGVLGFDIRAVNNHPLYDASGTDMFASAMQRLGNEGIQVNKIRGAWVSGTDSINTVQYLENIASGMSKENVALNTWTGRISQKYGYTKVEKIETIGGVTYVTFGK